MSKNEERYEPGELVWARADEGSLGQLIVERDDRDGSGLIYGRFADAVETHQKLVDMAVASGSLPPPEMPTLCFDVAQIARSRDKLEDHEPALEGPELQDVINEATNALAIETSMLLVKHEQYTDRRWGGSSVRAMVARAAGLGAVKGVVEGQLLILGPPPAILGIVDSTARTVAMHMAREAGRDDAAQKLLHVQREAEIERALSGMPLRADGKPS